MTTITIQHEQIIHLTASQTQIALRYGVPISIRDKHRDIYNLLCIANRTLRRARQQEQAEEMWRRVLDGGNYYNAIFIMGEHVALGEASGPVPKIGWLGGMPHG